MLEAVTSSMRSAAGELRRAGQSAEALAGVVGDEATAVASVVQGGGVSGAAVRAIAAVAAQLTVCAGGIEHAAGGVAGSADAFDEVDSAVAAGMSGVGRAG